MLLGLLFILLGATLQVACVAAGSAESQPSQALIPVVTAPGFFEAEPVGAGFSLVVSIEHAGDERLFVAQRTGEIFVLQPDGTSAVFLDLSDRVDTNAAEYGFFDMAFHPDYLDPNAAGAGQFFVTYTGNLDESVYTFVSRFTVSADPDVADPGSETWLLKVEQNQPVHKGGGLDFDRGSGLLYVGIGEDWQAPLSQDPVDLKGKILRLNVDAVPRESTGDATALVTPEVWAMGLRNPWRLDVDEASGLIFVGEVGDAAYEEVNLVPLGEPLRNYGWPCMEGPEPYEKAPDEDFCLDGRTFDLPHHAYAHAEARCAVIGGTVQRQASSPARYVFGDMCSRELFLMEDTGQGWATSKLGQLDGVRPILTFGQDSAGNVYVGRGEDDGPIYRLALP